MTSVVKRGEFIAMKTVIAVAQHMDDHGAKSKINGDAVSLDQIRLIARVEAGCCVRRCVLMPSDGFIAGGSVPASCY